MEPASPFWISHGPELGLAAFVAVFALLAVGIRFLASLILGTYRSASTPLHWTERNRRRLQETVVGMVLGLALPLWATFLVYDSVAPTFPSLGIAFLTTYFLLRFAVIGAGRPAMRATDDPEHRKRWEWPGSLVSLILLFSRSFVFAGIGTVAASIVPAHRWAIFVGTVLLVAAFNAPWGRIFLLAVGTLRKPGERLQRLVTETAMRLGRPVPPCYEVRGIGLNALAWPLWGIVGVTRLAMDCLDDDDVRALLMHEFGHLAEPPAVVRLRRIASYAPLVFFFGPLFRAAFPSSGALGFFVAFSVFVLISLRLKTGLAGTEDAADKYAVDHGGNPIAYARALEKLYRYNGYPAVQGAKTLHSDLYDRMLAVGATPEYPRPEAPSKRRRFAALYVAMIAFMVTTTTVKIFSDDLVGTERSSTTLALNGWQKYRRAWIYGELARRESDPVRAGSLLDIAIEADPAEPVYLMNRAMVAAQSGDCGRAGARLMQGLTAIEKQPHVTAKLALWFRGLERYVSETCNHDEGVARTD